MTVIDRSVTVMIDAEKCVGCEACLQVCPSETLTMLDGKAVVTGQESLGCGHCAAVCPTGAIREGIQDWQHTGRDRLFHGATAVILVGGRSGAACPREDALLAVQNMLLGAHAMGLGTCLIGFAVSAIERASSLKDFLKIPRDESIYGAIAVGYPDERYCRLPGRKPAPVRVWSGA